MPFDESRANAICNFAERYCVLPETGQLVKLQDWQRAWLQKTFGTLNDAGLRVIRTVYNEIPKKNGKSAIASIIALFMLCADGEKSAEVYSVAGSAQQARVIFDAALSMVKASPLLSEIIKPYKYSLIHRKTGSVFRVLASDATNLDGIKPSCILFDEMHEQPDRRLWDVLRGGGLARRQPLTVVTTTAGHDRTSIAWELHEYAANVRDGKLKDESWLPVIYGVPEDVDLSTEIKVLEAARMSNPSFGVTFSESDYMSLYREALNAGPARFNSWKRYHLNMWTQLETAWIPFAEWQKCGQRTVNEQTLLAGRKCFPSFDLSNMTDLTAFGFLFPNADANGKPDGTYDYLVKHYMPRARVIEAELRDKQPYRAWADKGFLTLTDGAAIDYERCRKDFLALLEKYPPINREITCDDYNAWQFCQTLRTEGYEIVVVNQKAKGISAPAKELLRLVLEGKIYHGGNPLLNWSASQAEVNEDEHGNLKIVKGAAEKRKRIDGLMALVYAINRAMLTDTNNEVKSVPSVYDDRGVFIL